MKAKKTVISVIVPTHNRRSALQRLLDALGNQTFPLDQVEVIVVADGCTDGTVDMLYSYQAPYTLRYIQQAGQGQSVARNQGAAQAAGELLLFIDDDVEPTPALIEGHVRTHRHQPGHVVIGPYPLAPQGAGFLHIKLRLWWETIFSAMCRPGHRFSYQDLLSGNLSIEAMLFAKIGGFNTDPVFRAHEDYELGIRLLKAGIPFACAANAIAYHHDQSDFNRNFLRKRHEGRADVQLALRFPEIFSTLPLARFEKFNLSSGLLFRYFAFHLPAASDVLVINFGYLLNLLERLRMRNQWRRLFDQLQAYWYWRGVAEEVGSWQALADLLQRSKHSSDEVSLEIELDLSQGLHVAEQQLDAERPAAARLRYGQHLIGLIPAQPGAEPLRGIHLRPILATVLTVPLLEALVLEGVIPTGPTTNRWDLAKSINSKSIWFGPLIPGKMWFEQFSQWKQVEYKASEPEQILAERWNRFRELERETAWLEHERAYWQRLAEQRERLIQLLQR